MNEQEPTKDTIMMYIDEIAMITSRLSDEQRETFRRWIRETMA